ncbi:hypothetical protein, unlikely [Trypanosoma brucei gambiense DAL972]|uniref:Uncharacterized protein n=1 Tax=Trypanosoma brucei gambiense (strain MHOM/CI/86/DAL972) TaxID=679716 RepID=C9ZMA3_TRYB9|nr:hypothetical protein, unlikely [Trypanosoma brucei gambiense DAL972]CBH10776.1 hypothetical protein, unlikely [Trypanosoma brucei gambiense DAL972]|eukprot:XP_011773064.1 hypothetical protein, unlikely [Trypanosoma brucei gambiense DAL972]
MLTQWSIQAPTCMFYSFLHFILLCWPPLLPAVACCLITSFKLRGRTSLSFNLNVYPAKNIPVSIYIYIHTYIFRRLLTTSLNTTPQTMTFSLLLLLSLLSLGLLLLLQCGNTYADRLRFNERC